jgi:hypothetical protein
MDRWVWLDNIGDDTHNEPREHTPDRVPSRVQARDERCADPSVCDLPGHQPKRDMHEPKPYTGELDWSDHLHPFVD